MVTDRWWKVCCTVACCAVIAAIWCLPLRGQLQSQPGAEGLLRNGDMATVKASGARPLLQAVTEIRREYGWVVDYEDPPYESRYDVGTVPWPAHPGAGWKVPADGSFSSTYPENPHLWSSMLNAGNVLRAVVSDYNKSAGPGTFRVIKQSDGSYAVVGVTTRDDSGKVVGAPPLLDLPISIPPASRTVADTLRLIVAVLSGKTGTPIVMGTMPSNLIHQLRVHVGGAGVPARSLLLKTVAETRRKLVWTLLYDPQFQRYVLNMAIATRRVYRMFGEHAVVPLDAPHTPAIQP